MSTSFARDYIMTGSIAATRDGKIRAVKVDVLADHGAFNGTAQPTKFPAGFFHVFTGSYDLEAAHCSVTGVYTNKAPGGVAYACSFRVTEAVYLVERMVDVLARELEMDRAAQAHGHRRAGHGRRRRGARAPDRQGRRPAVGADPGAGPRDDVRADRRRGARHPHRGHRGRARRHRPDTVRPGHVRQPLDAGE